MKSVSGLRARNRIYLGEGVGEEQEEQNMSTKRNRNTWIITRSITSLEGLEQNRSGGLDWGPHVVNGP